MTQLLLDTAADVTHARGAPLWQKPGTRDASWASSSFSSRRQRYVVALASLRFRSSAWSRRLLTTSLGYWGTCRAPLSSA
eukprot:scaffold287_cov239-Pinguiococcus_pyrenoidosus.AAC.6